MAGTFGYELELGSLTAQEKEEVKRQVKVYRERAGLINNGEYYRLSDPKQERAAAWMFVSQDRSEALFNAVALEVHGNMAVNYIRMKGLEPEAVYRDCETGKKYTGGALMEAGIPLPSEEREYMAYQMYLVRE